MYKFILRKLNHIKYCLSLQYGMEKCILFPVDTLDVGNQTCFLSYRKFWLFSGNSKHCSHDADPECLCDPLKPEVSGSKSSLPHTVRLILFHQGCLLLKLTQKLLKTELCG